MTDRLTELRAQLRHGDNALEAEPERRRGAFNYTVHQRRIVFEKGVREQHAALKQKLAPYLT